MRKYTTEFFIERANKKHNNKYNYSKFVYINACSKSIIICPEHGEFSQTADSHIHGCGCPTCAKATRTGRPVRVNTEKFIKESKNIHGDIFLYDKTEFKNSYTYVIITCKKHGDFKIKPPTHLNGNGGCKHCRVENSTKTLEEFIIDANIKHNNKYDYSKFDYIKTDIKSIIICPKHGEFKQHANNHLQGNGCPKCESSKGELAVMNWLEQNSVKYVCEHKFDGCKNKKTLPFDFWLPDHNTCIEFDGRHHREIITRSKCIKKNLQNFINTGINDIIKTTYCLTNNIKLIRINNVKDIDFSLSKELV